MKYIYITLTFILFVSQNAFSQDIEKGLYSQKIIGKWIALDMNEEGELVPSKDNLVYDFIDNYTLAIYLNHKFIDKMKYSMTLVSGPGTAIGGDAYIKLISSTSADFNENYSLDIHYDESELFIVFEAPGTAVTKVFKKQN